MPKPTAIESRALAVLRRLGPSTATTVGCELWAPRDTLKPPQSWALPGGMVLKRLRDKGLVRRWFDGRHWLHAARAGSGTA